MEKLDILKNLKFGDRIAENEIEDLSRYFVSTEDWRRLFNNEVDIIYGSKGAGKSALYAILDSKKNALFEKNIFLASAENPRGNTVFENLATNPPTSEVEFVRLWKLYFLIITVLEFDKWGVEKDNADFRRIKEVLEAASLLPVQKGLKSILKTCRDYIKNFASIESLQPGVELNEVTGIPTGFSLKVSFRETTNNEKKNGIWSLDALYDLLETALLDIGFSLWIAIDRLDVAFSDNTDLETNALRALFRVYRDLSNYKQVKLKIFLRDDIWRRITEQGFREASHITRTLTITWTKATLLNLIIRRLLSNEVIISEYHLDSEKMLSNFGLQENLFYRVFPLQIDIGDKKPKTMDWILGRVRDGNNIVAPREIIHLLNESLQEQIRLIQIGQNELDKELLIAKNAFKTALEKVSKVKLEQTIYAEYPDLKYYIRKLEGQKTEQRTESLMAIWDTEREETIKYSKKLAEIGFFEEKGEVQSPKYWIPFIYRSELKLVQGAAD